MRDGTVPAVEDLERHQRVSHSDTHHHRSHRHGQSAPQGKPDSCWWEDPLVKTCTWLPPSAEASKQSVLVSHLSTCGFIYGMSNGASRTSFKTKNTINHVQLCYTALCCAGAAIPRINKRKTFGGSILSCATFELWSWTIHFVPWASVFPAVRWLECLLEIAL